MDSGASEIAPSPSVLLQAAIDSQVLDKIPVLENAHRNFDVDNDRLFGDLLGKHTKARQGKTANTNESFQSILLVKELAHNRIEVKILFRLLST